MALSTLLPLCLFGFASVDGDQHPLRRRPGDKYSKWASIEHADNYGAYESGRDWAYHYDEKWTFFDEEPDKTLADAIAAEPGDTYEVVYDLIARVLGKESSLASHFILELIVAEERAEDEMPSFLSKAKHAEHPFWRNALSLDVFELDNNGTNGVILRGSSAVALCVAFNTYLEQHCNTTYDWR